MNISMANSPLSVLTQHYGAGLKSTEEKIERFQKTQSQIDFFEGKKAALKNKRCTTMDEIAEKLELFNTKLAVLNIISFLHKDLYFTVIVAEFNKGDFAK